MKAVSIKHEGMPTFRHLRICRFSRVNEFIAERSEMVEMLDMSKMPTYKFQCQWERVKNNI